MHNHNPPPDGLSGGKTKPNGKGYRGRCFVVIKQHEYEVMSKNSDYLIE